MVGHGEGPLHRFLLQHRPQVHEPRFLLPVAEEGAALVVGVVQNAHAALRTPVGGHGHVPAQKQRLPVRPGGQAVQLRVQRGALAGLPLQLHRVGEGGPHRHLPEPSLWVQQHQRGIQLPLQGHALARLAAGQDADRALAFQHVGARLHAQFVPDLDGLGPLQRPAPGHNGLLPAFEAHRAADGGHSPHLPGQQQPHLQVQDRAQAQAVVLPVAGALQQLPVDPGLQTVLCDPGADEVGELRRRVEGEQHPLPGLRDQVELELAAEPDPRFAHPDLPDLQLGRHRQHAPGGPPLGQGDGALDGHLFLQLHIQCIYVETDLFHIHGHDLP